MSVIYAFLFASLLVLAYHLVKVIIKRRIQTNNQIADTSKAELKAKLWKLVSKYIRSKDADFRGFVACFTCGRMDDWRTLDCGHYIPKSISGDVLYFYEKNLAPQCISCNRLKSGNVEEYKARLIKKYGEGVILELNQLRRSPPLTTQDYKQMIDKYTNLLKQLK